MRTWRGLVSLGVKKITPDWADATWGPLPKHVTPCVRQNQPGFQRSPAAQLDDCEAHQGGAGTNFRPRRFRQLGGKSNSTHTLRSHRFQVAIISSIRLVASAPPPPPDAASGYSSS